MVSDLKLFEEDAPKLIINRRAIAAGLASLVAAPFGGRALANELKQLSNIPLSFNPDDFAMQMRDGIFLPDYRAPMARLLFDDGGATGWQRWLPNHTRKGGIKYGDHCPARTTKAVAIECCCPDANGNPRYSQLAIG